MLCPKIAVLQPFLKHAAVANRHGRGRHKASQDGPRATASYADAVSKLDEAVALADTLGCEVVLKQVRFMGPAGDDTLVYRTFGLPSW